MLATGVTFALSYDFLPVNTANTKLHHEVSEVFARRFKLIQERGRTAEIHAIIAEMMDLNPEELWCNKTAEEWFPPSDFAVSLRGSKQFV